MYSSNHFLSFLLTIFFFQRFVGHLIACYTYYELFRLIRPTIVYKIGLAIAVVLIAYKSRSWVNKPSVKLKRKQ